MHVAALNRRTPDRTICPFFRVSDKTVARETTSRKKKKKEKKRKKGQRDVYVSVTLAVETYPP